MHASPITSSVRSMRSATPTRRPTSRRPTHAPLRPPKQVCRFRVSEKQPSSKRSKNAVELSPEEIQSLRGILAATGLQQQLPSPSSPTEPPTTPANIPKDASQQLMQIISKGLEKETEDLQQLEGAMLLAEQLSLSGNASGPLASTASPQQVDVWQPIFASAGGFPRLLYIPVPEYFDMHRSMQDATAISISSAGSIDISSNTSPHDGAVNIITELGPFTTHFLGTCRWLSDTDFEYSIKNLRIDFGGKALTIPMFFKLENVLSFFLVTPELACARSKLGGTMLLQANPEKGKRYFTAW